jgi:TDG/mug DNA glycosylase family protein
VDRQTVDIYEAQSERYESRRTPRHQDEARAFAARALGARGADLGGGSAGPVADVGGGAGGPVADLGSGPGWYTPLLGERVLALDAARAMLRRTRQRTPGALLVQADLGALPLRREALAGAWARNSYVHLRSGDVPAALADLHRSLRLGAPVELTFFGGDVEGRAVFPDDDLPGRWFSTWSAQRLEDVVVGAGFVLDELARTERGDEVGLTVRARRDRTLPDTVAPGLRLLVCGLNPSVRAADAGVGFVTPGNRFWPAALAAGLVTSDRDPWHALRHRGVGMTDLVKRASARADGLTRDEYAAGLARVERLCAWLRPRAVCFVGLAGWRAAVDARAVAGPQARALRGSPVYVMPSTSGANASSQLPALTDHLRAATRLGDP